MSAPGKYEVELRAAGFPVREATPEEWWPDEVMSPGNILLIADLPKDFPPGRKVGCRYFVEGLPPEIVWRAREAACRAILVRLREEGLVRKAP